MKQLPLLLAIVLLSSLCFAQSQLHFDGNIVALTYGDYTLTKINRSDGEIGDWQYELKRDGEMLFTMGAGEVRSIYLEAAPVPALEGGTQQLALQRFTGGAHCCFYSAVLQLAPEFKVLFDTTDYGDSLGYQLTAEDLDGDGTLELMQSILTFDYFYLLPHVASPLPPAIFRYNEASGEYEPANDAFPEHVNETMRVSDARRRVKEFRATANVNEIETYHPYVNAVMTVALALAYTGQPEAARRYIEEEYALPDKTELLKAYDEKLAQCRYFQRLMGESP